MTGCEYSPRDVRSAWAVHALTASGVIVGMVGLDSVIDGHARAAIIWLVVALVLDGVDGPIARKLEVQKRIPLLNGFTIGKAPNSHLVLDDGYTSGQHAQIGMDTAGTCRLYDRNSTNGTFVNGARITEVVLDHGASVRIGSTELRFLAQ